ncbi:MAG: hypothetical protein WCQ99_00605, partial [Pseudomonadota bacterium]
FCFRPLEINVSKPRAKLYFTHVHRKCSQQKLSPRRLLRGENLLPAGEGFKILRSLPHGHVAAVLGTLRNVGLER